MVAWNHQVAMGRVGDKKRVIVFALTIARAVVQADNDTFDVADKH